MKQHKVRERASIKSEGNSIESGDERVRVKEIKVMKRERKRNQSNEERD